MSYAYFVNLVLSNMASLRNRFEEHLTCSVCLEQLKDPKVLPCLHSFCHGCIVNIAKKEKSNNINCPECRKVAQVIRQCSTYFMLLITPKLYAKYQTGVYNVAFYHHITILL